MQRAMARQAEAEREKRAKIIHAAGELEASAKLSQAAGVIATEPVAITLRYLQTLDRDRGGEELDDHLPAADRNAPSPAAGDCQEIDGGATGGVDRRFHAFGISNLKMVDHIFTSWNRLVSWMHQVELLRTAA